MSRKRQLSYEDALDHKEPIDIERLRPVIDLADLTSEERLAVSRFLDGEDDASLLFLQHAVRKMRAVAKVMGYHTMEWKE